MHLLKNEFNNFRTRMFCQDIDYAQIKQFSDKVKHHLGSSTIERNPYEIISLLHEMLNHNQSINTGAAPTIDTVHLYDLNLSLNQLQSLKRCIQKLEYPSEILDSLAFLFQFMLSNPSKLNTVYFMNCKIINDVLFHYKKTLKVKNQEYQGRSLDQIEELIDYGLKNNSTLLIDNLENHSIDESIRMLAQQQDTSSKIKERCQNLLEIHFNNDMHTSQMDSQ